MKIYAFMGLVISAAGLSACVVDDGYYNHGGYPGRTTVEYNHYDDRDRNYHHDRDDYDHDGDRNNHQWHCPPGQAKKGNC